MKKQVFLLFAALVFSQAAFAYVYGDFNAVAPSGQTLHYTIIGSTTTVAVIAPSGGSGWNAPWNSYAKPTGNLVIPDSVTYNGTTYAVTMIRTGAFFGCSGLTSVTIPNTVTHIDGYVSVIGSYGDDYYPVFGNCTGLTSITFPNSVTAISGFRGCTGLTSVTIPNSVTSIGQSAFYGCTGLTSVTIGDSVTSIGNSAFYGCTGLTSVTIPNSVTNIGSSAFSGCTGLTSVTIPNSVTSIGSSAFSGCTGLTSVTIPNSVTSIGQSAFYGCTGLTSMTIPNSVDSIGAYAFGNCTGLTSVVFNADSCMYAGAMYSSSYTNIVFDDCTNITSFTFGNNVKVIPACLCYSLTGLTSVTIPNSVTSIGDAAFYNCTGLASVTIGNSVTSIGQSAFSGCTGLTSVTIPNSVTSIGSSAFSGCTGLTSVTIPNSVTSIGSAAFESCSGLTSVTIGDSVTSIGASAFSGCVGMTSMKFLGQMPPQLGTDVFVGIQTDIPVYIPCGRLAYYVAQMPQFSNFVEQQVGFSAISDNDSMGSVQILTEPSCSNPNAVLYAVPADGYSFDHWSTGSIDNPYTLTVTSDTTVIAYFVSNGGTEGIGEVGEDDIHISVFNGCISVEGVEQKDIQVYDITGRITDNRALPSGVYIVKIGQLPARKVVVLR